MPSTSAQWLRRDTAPERRPRGQCVGAGSWCGLRPQPWGAAPRPPRGRLSDCRGPSRAPLVSDARDEPAFRRARVPRPSVTSPPPPLKSRLQNRRAQFWSGGRGLGQTSHVADSLSFLSVTAVGAGGSSPMLQAPAWGADQASCPVGCRTYRTREATAAPGARLGPRPARGAELVSTIRGPVGSPGRARCAMGNTCPQAETGQALSPTCAFLSVRSNSAWW